MAFLFLLFIVKLVYLFIQLKLWMDYSADPTIKWAKRRFKLLLTIGACEYFLFIMGLIMWAKTPNTRGKLYEILKEEDFLFLWIILQIFVLMFFLHALIFCLIYTFYLIILLVVYCYFKGYGAMQVEVVDTEFYDEDTDEEEAEKSKKKVIEGLVSVEYFVSKDAVGRLIKEFI